MKKIYKNRIINIDSTDIFDNKFLFDYLEIDINKSNIDVIFLSDLLEKKKNLEMLQKSEKKPATWSNVYSPEDEFEIFKYLFEDAIKNNKKIHIVGITLGKEIELIENYYKNLGFFSEDINAFKVDFSKVLVSVSVKIENLMFRGSDYKAMGKKIFFNPPIRESGEVKNMFKGINRGVTAGIYIKDFNNNKKDFLNKVIIEEHILPINMAKILNYNLIDFGFQGIKKELVINY